MCRNPGRAATALAMVLAAAALCASPAAAWPFSHKPAPAAKPETAPAAADKAEPARKASAQERAAADRLDPLARAAFWAREVDVDPTDTQAGVELSAALRQIGRYDEAAQAAGRVLVLNPNNLDALLETARDHIAAGKGFYAIEPLKKANSAYPRDWRPLSLLGVAYEQNQQPDLARQAYAQALALSPANPAILSNLALYYAARGDGARAEALLRQAVAEPGATAQERQNLALVLGLEGKLAESERIMREDLPPEAASGNIAYLKSAGKADHDWSAVKRAEAASGQTN